MQISYLVIGKTDDQALAHYSATGDGTATSFHCSYVHGPFCGSSAARPAMDASVGPAVSRIY